MSSLLRIVDANLNRSREGLRVCEDISRFILDDSNSTRSFKSLRHKISAASRALSRKDGLALLKSRNVKRDIGKITSARERKRKNIKEVFTANVERTKESLRVLEEITKLIDKKIAQDFKTARFRLYDLEKKTQIKLAGILHN